MGNTRAVATWTAAALAALAIVIALSAAVVRRTRRRGLPADPATARQRPADRAAEARREGQGAQGTHLQSGQPDRETRQRRGRNALTPAAAAARAGIGGGTKQQWPWPPSTAVELATRCPKGVGKPAGGKPGHPQNYSGRAQGASDADQASGRHASSGTPQAHTAGCGEPAAVAASPRAATTWKARAKGITTNG